MARDLSFIEPDWGMSQIDGDIATVSDAQEVSQNSKIRLQIILGEVYNDTRIGIPWLTDMVNTQVSINAKKQILRDVILSTPGARSLESLDVSVDDVTGLAVGTFAGTTENNEFFKGAI